MTHVSTSLRIAAAATLAIIATPIAAQRPVIVEGQALADGYKQERISFGDLNLKSEAGAKALRERVMHASSRVCEGIDRWYGRGMPVSWGRCFHITFDVAKPQVDALIDRARRGDEVASSMTVRVGNGRIAERQ